MLIIEKETWIKEAEKRYGVNKRDWKFKCPNCKTVQGFNDFIEAGVEEKEIPKYIGYTCIGRFKRGSKGTIFNKKKPCDYTNGGLFTLTNIRVKEGEKQIPMFDFSETLEEKKKIKSKGEQNMVRRVISKFSDGIYTYKQETTNCGKESCKKCASGGAHGPYWYKYFRQNGKIRQIYVGKTLKITKKRGEEN